MVALTMSDTDNRTDHVTPDINCDLMLIPENAPLARQESLEEEEVEEETDIDKLHHIMNGTVVHGVKEDEDEDPDQLQQIVVVADCNAGYEVSSLGCSKPLDQSKDIKVQISLGAKHKDIEESPSKAPVIIQHRAQVLQIQDASLLDTALTKQDPYCSIESEPSSEEHNHLPTDNRSNYSVSAKLSQDLIVTVENPPDQELKLTEKLPEVLLVAEQLPERLKAAKNILARVPSNEKEPTAPPYQSLETEDDGSPFTRADTITELAEILQPETEGVRHSQDKVDSKPRPITPAENESCISPLFIGIYSFLGFLIIVMIGLNFWFGFHLLFFIGLLAVIALFSCVLTEFNDFHNEPD